jgi:antitoxin ParD1/3/4
MSKVITPHFEQLIDRFIASGRFNNKSEVIRAGLRLLEEHELQLERATRADLERILDEDLADRRPVVPAEQLLAGRKR